MLFSLQLDIFAKIYDIGEKIMKRIAPTGEMPDALMFL